MLVQPKQDKNKGISDLTGEVELSQIPIWLIFWLSW